MSKKLLKRRKRKKRLRRLKQLAQPTSPMVTTADPSTVLAEAYPISVYWDNDANKFFAELSDFGECMVHADTWLAATTAAKIAQQLLVEAYRLYGYTLPEVG